MTAKYATLSVIINYKMTLMYKILIDNKVIECDDKNIAFANYRSFCRDYKNKSYHIKLMHNDILLHDKPANLQLLDDVDAVTTNDLLSLLLECLDIDITELKKIISESDLQLSKSRVGSWTLPTDNRRYTQMHNDELAAVIKLLLTDRQLSSNSLADKGYTPSNYQQLVKMTGLSNVDFYRTFDIPEQTFYCHIKGSRSMRWQDWQELVQKVENF